MTDRPRLTEERLKTWLAADQASRERLCLGVLSLSPRYSDVKPRRPKGGPDGGRDLEAKFDRELQVRGAVGFRNNAQDSPEDKRWVATKFEADLDSALAEPPKPGVFVFFTNVDLTPAEVSALEQQAIASGIRVCDIIYRERIRIALDSPQGLALRHQYLGITMTEPEQAAFFSTWGSELETLVRSGLSTIDEKLARLEFLQECSKPLKGIDCQLELDREYHLSELPHFRVAMGLVNYDHADPVELWLFGKDSYGTFVSDGVEAKIFATITQARSKNPDAESHPSQLGRGVRTSVNHIGLGAWVAEITPFNSLGALDEIHPYIFVSQDLARKVKGIAIVANEYLLCELNSSQFRMVEDVPAEPWPFPPVNNLSDPWNAVRTPVSDAGLSFAYHTPKKLT